MKGLQVNHTNESKFKRCNIILKIMYKMGTRNLLDSDTENKSTNILEMYTRFGNIECCGKIVFFVKHDWKAFYEAWLNRAVESSDTPAV